MLPATPRYASPCLAMVMTSITCKPLLHLYFTCTRSSLHAHTVAMAHCGVLRRTFIFCTMESGAMELYASVTKTCPGVQKEVRAGSKE